MSLIEVGASAGLCLYPDRYAYSYDGMRVGSSTVEIDVACTGAVPVPDHLPEIAWRVGIDLNPLDVRDPDDVDWLRACIWPEHVERRRRLDAAVEIVAAEPLELIAGDLLTELDAIIDRAPADTMTVVIHSAVLSYVERTSRHDFASSMRARKDLIWMWNEALGIVDGLSTDRRPSGRDGAYFLLGVGGVEVAAITDPHGRWLDWSN